MVVLVAMPTAVDVRRVGVMRVTVIMRVIMGIRRDARCSMGCDAMAVHRQSTEQRQQRGEKGTGSGMTKPRHAVNDNEKSLSVKRRVGC